MTSHTFVAICCTSLAREKVKERTWAARFLIHMKNMNIGQSLKLSISTLRLTFIMYVDPDCGNISAVVTLFRVRSTSAALSMHIAGPLYFTSAPRSHVVQGDNV